MDNRMFPQLQITVYSFSYRKSGPPVDTSGNGGGFVFDCRALPNPHRVAELKDKTGQDQEVIAFFSQYPVVQQFIDLAVSLVQIAAQNYTEREFTNLYVAFGCTGGQHRSVYCAETLARLLKDKYMVTIKHQDLSFKTGQ
jgi:RNase adaptor protein for sRNA GlmZ degradation